MAVAMALWLENKFFEFYIHRNLTKDISIWWNLLSIACECLTKLVVRVCWSTRSCVSCGQCLDAFIWCLILFSVFFSLSFRDLFLPDPECESTRIVVNKLVRMEYEWTHDAKPVTRFLYGILWAELKRHAKWNR